VQGYVRTRDGTSIYYEVLGEGEPLVLIEGLGYAHWMWVEQRPCQSTLSWSSMTTEGPGCPQSLRGPTP